MAKYKLLVFDLDGTIADTRNDLACAVNHALVSLSLPELAVEQVGGFVGDGLERLMQRSLDAAKGSAELLERSIDLFRDHYKQHLVDNTTLYAGVGEALKSIKEQEMVVLTNKPRRYSLPVLEHLGVDSLFKEVYGGDTFPSKKPDPFPLQEIMRQRGAEKGETMMVGDSGIDIATARAAGTSVCAVSYGFTPHEKLAELHPDWLVYDLRQLVDILSK